jgi:hypothetical protein
MRVGLRNIFTLTFREGLGRVCISLILTFSRYGRTDRMRKMPTKIG